MIKETDWLCVCGGPRRALCPQCFRFVRVVNGKLAEHEHGFCLGSHMEYKPCKGSGKPASSESQAGRNLDELLGKLRAKEPPPLPEVKFTIEEMRAIADNDE